MRRMRGGLCLIAGNMLAVAALAKTATEEAEEGPPCQLPREDVATLTEERWFHKYHQQHPVVLTGALRGWPAMEQWDSELLQPTSVRPSLNALGKRAAAAH